MSDITRVLITGTSRGIGKELLKLYSHLGVQVIAIDKVSDPDLVSINSSAVFQELDISNESAVENFVAFLANNDIIPDVVIFNAAIHEVDNELFIDYNLLRLVLEVNFFSTLKFLSCLMPILNKPTTFVFCSSGVIIFPNPSNLGYFLGKLAITRVFDLFSHRYANCGFRFKSVILGPIESDMLRDSRPPKNFVRFLRDMTTGTPYIAAQKIVKFVNSPFRRMYYRPLSAFVLWSARLVQALLPASYKAYNVKHH